jgi:GTP-binding protein
MKNLAKVVIIGRANVGKSTLFNRLSTDIKSLTLDYEGVTRDFISDVVCWQNVCFQLTDSGGISLQKLHEPLAEKVRQVALKLVDTADLVLLMVDGSVGFLPQDRAIVQYLHKAKKNIILVINKSDVKRTEENLGEFVQSGVEHQIPISAQHGKGIDILLETIIAQLPKTPQEASEEEPAYSVVLLGKPNVGKSSLLNMLLESERMLVTPQAGTTREAVTEKVKFYQETIALTDTPGIRRQRAITRESLESLMIKTSFAAVKRAQIVLLMVDGTDGHFSDQELKLAFYAFEQGKALIILFNKDDLMTELMRSDLKHDMQQYDYFFKKIPTLAISAKTGKNVGKILPLAKKVWQRYSQRFDDLDISRILKAAIKRKPLYHQSERLIIYDAKQIGTAPITILLSVNEPDWFGPSQLAFLENALRNQFDLLGVPVLFKTVKVRD